MSVTVGRYSILRKLATGGMAQVYLAKVAGPGGFEKHVVLKTILPQLADDELYVKMFLDEAKLAAQLDHPNIVHVFDFGEADGAYFLTMEYVEGATLRHVTRWAHNDGQTIAPTLLARIASLACEGLAYAHQFVAPATNEVKRLVHRDVSPENIMLSRNGGVKLLDFGVAKSGGEEHTNAGWLKGKIAYMPPEQLRGGALDHRVDIYALGVVLYQALSGRRPYEQSSDLALITAILNDEPVPLLKHRLDLPDALLDIVAKAIAKDPNDRFQTCGEMRDALEAYIAYEGDPVSSGQVSSLVERFLADPTSRAGLSISSGSQPDLDAAASKSVLSLSQVSAVEVPREPAKAGPVNTLMSKASRSTPGMAGPFAASARSNPGMRGPFAPLGALDDEPVTDPSLPAQQPLETLPRPRLSAPRPAPRSTATKPVEPGERKWTRAELAPEPIRHALRENLRADRAGTLLRGLPAVVAQLCNLAPDVPWAVREALAGVIDAALLADDQTAIVRLLERATNEPGRDHTFARLVGEELSSPLRIAWLVERLRYGMPADLGGLRAWLVRLGDAAAPVLLEALQASEPGPAQDLFAEALAPSLSHGVELVAPLLEQPEARHVAALCRALELSRSPGSDELFARLGAADAFPVEVMSGRARALGSQALSLLGPALDSTSSRERLEAIDLVGELCDLAGAHSLAARVKAAAFEGRPPAERAATWAALVTSGGEDALRLCGEALQVKSTFFGGAKATDSKLSVVEGLARSKSEGARELLESIAKDKGQARKVRTAAEKALKGGAGSLRSDPLAGERRTHLDARITLDLVLLARASTTIDVGSGLLDVAIERFRDSLRQLHRADGRVEVAAADVGPVVNGMPVVFGSFHDRVLPLWQQALRARDLKGFTAKGDGALTTHALRSLLFRAFDPDGQHEALPHFDVLTFSGQTLQPVPRQVASQDGSTATRELYAFLRQWLEAQAEAVSAGHPPDLVLADAALDEWASLMADSAVDFIGVARWGPKRSPLSHALNTAALSMAFARDLGLPRSALREAAELALMLGIAEASSTAVPDGPMPGAEERLHAAALLLVHRLNRMGTVLAVAAVETGAARPGRGQLVLASLHALARTFDALTAGEGLTAATALEAMNGKLRARFSHELLGLFTQWVFAQ